MKMIILLLSFMIAQAEIIKLSKEQEKNWHIKTAKLKQTNYTPVATSLVEVVTPPHLLYSVTIPYQAQVVKLYVTLHQSIKKGEPLVEISANKWIEAQKDTIADAVKLRELKTTQKRKNRLCKEGIIPKKECIILNSTIQNQSSRVSASKAILSLYGASDDMIEDITKNLKLYPTLLLKAQTDGSIIKLNAKIGQSIDSKTPIMIVQKDGKRWLQSKKSLSMINAFKKDDIVMVNISGKSYKAKVLHIAKTINNQNQTQNIIFELEDDTNLLSGLRKSATFTLKKPSFKAPKEAVIKLDSKPVVFVKSDGGYESVEVEILAEDKSFYYLKKDDKLLKPVAISSLAILKSMAGE